MAWMTPSSSNKSKSTSSTPATAPSVSEWKPDLFAQKFVPARLQTVNSLPALHTILSPAPDYTNFEEYAQTFLPKTLYTTCASSQFLATIRSTQYALDVNPQGPQIPLSELSMENYAMRFKNLLIEERQALAEEFKQYNLYEVPLENIPYQKDVYKISVPGLREYIPAIYVGDSLIIRCIRFPPHVSVGHFDGTEYVAYIWSIDRLNVLLFSTKKD